MLGLAQLSSHKNNWGCHDQHPHSSGLLLKVQANGVWVRCDEWNIWRVPSRRIGKHELQHCGDGPANRILVTHLPTVTDPDVPATNIGCSIVGCSNVGTDVAAFDGRSDFNDNDTHRYMCELNALTAHIQHCHPWPPLLLRGSDGLLLVITDHLQVLHWSK